MLAFASMTVAELREKVFQDKKARRRYLMTAPIPEKLRSREEMRDMSWALAKTREANKARVPAAIGASQE